MQKGFSLLEVLIALALISLGFLGFAGAELRMVQQMRVTQAYHLANQQIISLDEQLHIVASAQAAIQDWQQQTKALFPFSRVEVQRTSDHLYQIIIQWQIAHEDYAIRQNLSL